MNSSSRPRGAAPPAPSRSRCLAAATLLTLVAMLTLGARPLAAHELRPAVADVTRSEGTLRVSLRLNLEALLAGIGAEHDDTDDSPRAAEYDALRELPPEALEGRLERFAPELLDAIALLVDADERLVPTLLGAELAPVGDTRLARDSLLLLEAPLPARATTFSWGWAEAFGPVIVRSGEVDSPDAFAVYLLAGERSDPLPLGAGSTAAPPSRLSQIVDYVRIGFLHIVPLGLDHVLFVIGLFLLSPRAGPIVGQVTAFTIAHSITLALGALGLFQLPADVVEPLIALSITAVCVENLFTTSLHRWRMLLVFAFGLLHGLGFASVLGEAGTGTASFVTALLAFNVGVELGQLAVILACFALVGWWFRERSWYRRVVTVPASLAIGAVGLFWFIQRTIGG